MGILNRLFGSTESISKEIEKDDKRILKSWNDYIATVPQKQTAIERLKSDSGENDLLEIKRLLTLELSDISGEERLESDLTSDLNAIEHSKKIRRVHRLDQCLGYAKTKHEYAYHLLHRLHSLLKNQMHLVNRIKDSKNADKLISQLKQQLELELIIIKKIEGLPKFHALFIALAKREHIVRTMDAKEARLIKKMESGIGKVFSGETDKGITYKWAIEVYNKVQDIIGDHAALMAKGLSPHSDVDFEFVNSPEFEGLARETIQSLRKRKVSELMLNAFVHLFREWYNHERD